MNGNVIVGQSGGPTSVINSSLVGVFQGAKRAGCGKIYGMRNGLEDFAGDMSKAPTTVKTTLILKF